MRSIKMIWAIVGITIFIMGSDIRAQDEDWFDKGRKLLGQKQYDDAIEAFSTAIEIIPRDYQSFNYRGVCWALKDDFHRAIADYSKAIEIRPTYAEAYNNRGFAYTQTGNLNAALSDYSRAIEINPFFVDAYNNKAWVLATCSDQRIRNGGQAVILARKAVELEPDISSMDTLAAAYAAAGDFNSAIDTQTKAIQKLLLDEKNDEVPKYMAHLRSYRSHQALLVDYTARPRIAKAESVKSSLKARTKTTMAKPDAAPPAEPATKMAKQTNSASAKPSPAIKAGPAKKAVSQTSGVKKIRSPSTTNPSVKKAPPSIVKPVPYTIQVSSFRDPQQSIQVARKLNNGGDPAFTSPVDISGKGKWHQVFVGNYKTLDEARAAANDLKRRKFRYVNIAKKPYTVQIGQAIPRSEASKIQAGLQARGYFSYSLPAKAEPNRIRVLIGAFESKQAAVDLSNQLKKDGFRPKIVSR